MNKVLKIIIDVVFIIIIVVLLGYFVLRLSGKIDVYQVKTGSMEPTIKVDDYIMIYKTNDYKKEDIVTFKFEDTLVTHRIVKIKNNKIVTKGDANNTYDDEIDIESVVGKVIIIGGILNFAINYKFLIIGLMFGLYLLTCYLDRDKKEKEDKDGKEKENNKS